MEQLTPGVLRSKIIQLTICQNTLEPPRPTASRLRTGLSRIFSGKIQAQEFPNVNDCFKTLADKKADAVVYDAPILLYYAAHEGKGKAQLVGSIFQNEAYGIVFPQNSPYRKEINLALLKVREKGIYLNLYQKWFGATEGGDSGQEPPQ